LISYFGRCFCNIWNRHPRAAVFVVEVSTGHPDRGLRASTDASVLLGKSNAMYPEDSAQHMGIVFAPNEKFAFGIRQCPRASKDNAP